MNVCTSCKGRSFAGWLCLWLTWASLVSRVIVWKLARFILLIIPGRVYVIDPYPVFYIYRSTCIYIYIYVYTYIYIYVYLFDPYPVFYIYISTVCMQACKHTYIYIYLYMFILYILYLHKYMCIYIQGERKFFRLFWIYIFIMIWHTTVFRFVRNQLENGKEAREETEGKSGRMHRGR